MVFLFFFFLICIPLIFFSCLTALARTFSIILNRYGKSRQPSLVPDFSEIALSFSLFNLTVDLLHVPFIMFGYVLIVRHYCIRVLIRVV